jgi:hypothetical protein
MELVCQVNWQVLLLITLKRRVQKISPAECDIEHTRPVSVCIFQKAVTLTTSRVTGTSHLCVMMICSLYNDKNK